MPNEANRPFADALAKAYPPINDAKIFTASAEAEKMLAFWSLKQLTISQVLRIGNELFRVVKHACPHCEQDLSAQAVRMSKKEREMMAALVAMLKPAETAKPASKPTVKPAKQAAKVIAVPTKQAESTPAASEEEITLEQLDALTTPGGGA